MAKPKKAKARDNQTVIQKFNITKLPNDRNLKSLDAWHQAIAAAEDIYVPVRKSLYDLYKNIVLDTHLTAVMDNQRIIATTNIPWMCVDANGEEIPEIQKHLDTTFFEDILTYAIESRFYGHSLMQIDWNAQKVELVPRENVNPRDKLVLPNALMPTLGVAYNEAPYDALTIEVGKPDNLGLLLKVAPWVILKRGDISDWATFCEVFGMPLRVGYYDASNPANLAQVDKAMKEMGGAGYLVMPDNSKVEFPSAGSTQGNDVYDRFMRACDEQISKAIVAQTMTTENGSSKSQGEVHLEIQESLFAADRKLVERVLNEQLIPLIIAQGGVVPEGAKFKAADEEEELSTKDRLEMDLRIHKEVGRLPKAYFAEEYNVEFVDDSDDEMTPQPEPTPPPAQKPKKEAKPKDLSFDLDDIPLHEQGLFLRLFEGLLSFFGIAPKK